MEYTIEDLRRFIGEPDFTRGLSYYRMGKVLSHNIEHGSELSGTVKGSGRKVYSQSISLFWHGELLDDVDGECSCPVGWNCKHVTAVLLSAIETATATPQKKLGYEAETWIRKIKLASKKKPPVSKYKIQYILFYLLGYNEGSLRVEIVKVAKKKNGQFSAASKRYNFHSWIQRNDPPKFVTEADRRICRQMHFLEISDNYYSYSNPSTNELTALIEEIILTGRARWECYDSPPLIMTPGWSGHLIWNAEPGGEQKLRLSTDGGTLLEALPTNPLQAIDPLTGDVGPVKIDLSAEFVVPAVHGPSIAPAEADLVSEAMAQAGVADSVPLPTRLLRKNITNLDPSPQLTLMGINGKRQIEVNNRPRYSPRLKWQQDTLPVCRLTHQYGDHIAPVSPTDNLVTRQGDTILTIQRDADKEDIYFRYLMTLGLRTVDQLSHIEFSYKSHEIGDLSFADQYQNWAKSGEVDIHTKVLEFTSIQVPKLRNEGWKIVIDPSWPIKLHDGPYEMQGGVSTDDNGWFSFYLDVTVDGHSIDILPVVTTVVALLPIDRGGDLAADFNLDTFLQEQQFYLPLSDNNILPIEGRKLKPLIEAFMAVYGIDGNFHPGEAENVHRAAEALEGSGIVFEGGSALRELGARLQKLANPQTDVTIPKGLIAEMRPYQKTGYGWLRDLGETGFSGLLADDMGLGKTLQTLALLAKRYIEDNCEIPSLLVVPTSLLGNWRREAEKFAPKLKILTLHGQNRKADFDKITDYHLIMTTYPLLHRDHATLFAVTYDLAILDEAQAVKNPAASVSKRIRDIDARQRIALTGTPIENSLEELWSIFDWLIPGLLGNRKTFREKLRTPIEQHGSTRAQSMLNSRIAPFILRRTKEQVATDLPPKTETTTLIPLSNGQRQLYEPIRTAMDKRVRDAISAKGINASRITILDALLKLRQVCCDPGLVKLDAARKVTESAKRTRMMEMLSELIAEGRKVLIFSQFVEMLKLIEADVISQNWSYAMLTGSTRDRDGEVNKFQSGPASLFLISLKAGGVGLNLTAADTVIIYDPWWNPAVENQAVDRSHRIGQNKPVFVYRLVAEGTVEEAILKMQRRKQALADGVLKEGNNGPVGMNQEDLAALFKPLSNS